MQRYENIAWVMQGEGSKARTEDFNFLKTGLALRGVIYDLSHCDIPSSSSCG